MASSMLYPGEPVITDDTPVVAEGATGLRLPSERVQMLAAEAYEGIAQPFPSELLIPESEWQARCEELDEQKSGLDELSIRAGLPCHDQNGIPYCHTADTEVLTEKGWVRWSDYNWQDLLGTVNVSTGLMEFQAPVQRHVYPFNGEMVYSTHSRCAFGLTPDHNLLVKKRNRSKQARSRFQPGWSTMRVRDLTDSVYKIPHAPSGFIGTEIDGVTVPGGRGYTGNDFVQLLAYLVADGYAGSTGRCVGFCCYDPNRYEHAFNLAMRCGFKENGGKRGDFRIQDAALNSWIKENCYTSSVDLGSHTKKIPELLRCVSQRQLDLFLGCYGDQNHTKPGRHYFSVSKRLIDDLQELFLRVGRRATISQVIKPHRNTLANGQVVETRHPLYELYPSITEELNLYRKELEQAPYRGLVYCAGVPNHTLVTRYNGDVLISRNCWIHGPTHCMEILRVTQNQKIVLLSATSAGAKIKNFRKQGGWGKEGLQFISDHGVVPQSLWPENKLQRSYDTDEAWEEAAKYKTTEWWVLRDRNLADLFSCLFRRVPVAVGYSWWSHEVTAVRPLWLDGKPALRIRNSWSMSWGSQGFGVLQGSKMHPDDQVAPRVAIAS